ncbi:hypothetical protein NKG94_17295 [Micromonospora sp. M12]
MVDIALPGWLNGGRDHFTEIYRPAVEAARWTANSRLSAAARELISLGRGQPQLRGLDVARSPLSPVPGVRVVDDAVAAVSAARTWMWQNPKELTAVHLQLGTQLGLAVHVLANNGDPRLIGGWRQAAIAAADLRATLRLVRPATLLLSWQRFCAGYGYANTRQRMHGTTSSLSASTQIFRSWRRRFTERYPLLCSGANYSSETRESCSVLLAHSCSVPPSAGDPPSEVTKSCRISPAR